ncbi:hypothetical protein [Deinococcus malanensis]|uniref:hypothetical protein n=1 Tax=Deinococcus malanensis TaxID=1706855 RepID=UPI00166A5B31|nr:hypothetical protein [Deinococcus malanensis]
MFIVSQHGEPMYVGPLAAAQGEVGVQRCLRKELGNGLSCQAGPLQVEVELPRHVQDEVVQRAAMVLGKQSAQDALAPAEQALVASPAFSG